MVRSKYGAEKITTDGIRFDSKVESQYYEYLKELKYKEKIFNFELQPRYTICPPFEKDGRKYRRIEYVADFLIYHLDNTLEVIDIKGMPTEAAKLKAKLFNYNYPSLKLTWLVRNIKYGKDGWLEYEENEKRKRRNKRK